MRFVTRLFGMVFLLGVIPVESQVGVSYYLDLPNASGEGEETEEDLPEIIQFYGQEFEGDGAFFSLDHSPSMTNIVAGMVKLDILKREATKALNEMNERMDFGLVSFDEGVQWLSESPMAADDGKRQLGIAWVLNMRPSNGTCIGGGTKKALEIAHGSDKPHRFVILVSDGEPSRCRTGPHNQQQARDWIRSANRERLPVNTIFVGTPSQSSGKNWLRQLAVETGGTFTEASG